MRHRGIGLLLLAAIAWGCAARISPRVPSVDQDLEELQRDVELLPPFPLPSSSPGSLWTDAGPGAALVRDTRAYRINDLLTIAVRERSLGSNEASSELSRSSESQVGASVAFGLEDPTPTPGRFDLSQVLNTSSDSSFTGDGETTRSNSLSGSITARVMRVLPNGDLVIAGRKTVMINRERHILTLVGSVRAVDVDARNRVPSDVIGDLTIRLWGRGEIDATTQQGWFMKFLQRLWPF